MTENLVVELVAGVLDDRRRRSTELHIDQCRACRLLVARVAEVRQSAAVMSLLGSHAGDMSPDIDATLPAEQGTSIDLAPGTTVGGTYRIMRRIGAGGMGIVYQARDLELQRDVALKVHQITAGIERLQREAVAMAQVSHPNVVTVFGVGRVEGRLYVAMEYVPGKTLNEWMREPRSWSEVLELLLAAAEGLAAAHDAGFVHRDIKPSNILIGHDARPRIGDFGLVRVAGDGEPSRSTGDGDLDRSLVSSLTYGTVGTPAYMAPEQHVNGNVDGRADQFAFCVVLYEALYGDRPWSGSSFRGSTAQVPAEPPRGKAPAWLWPVIRRGLAHDPAERYPDMRALVAALRRGPQRRLVTGIAAVVGAAAIGGGLWAAWLRDAHALPPALPGSAASYVYTEGATGYWVGSWGRLVLREVNGEILGVYDHDRGTLRGTMIGNTFVGWWCEAPSRKPKADAGEIRLDLITGADGILRLDGRWRYGTEGAWDPGWDLIWQSLETPADLLKRFDQDPFCPHP